MIPQVLETGSHPPIRDTHNNSCAECDYRPFPTERNCQWHANECHNHDAKRPGILALQRDGQCRYIKTSLLRRTQIFSQADGAQLRWFVNARSKYIRRLNVTQDYFWLRVSLNLHPSQRKSLSIN